MPNIKKPNVSFATSTLQAFEAAYQTQVGLLICHNKVHFSMQSKCTIQQLQNLFNCNSSNNHKLSLKNVFNRAFPPFKFACYKRKEGGSVHGFMKGLNTWIQEYCRTPFPYRLVSLCTFQCQLCSQT